MEKIIYEPFVCDKCGKETDVGRRDGDKCYCENCYKKIQSKKNQEVKNDNDHENGI